MLVSDLINEIARLTLGNASNIDTDFNAVCLDGIISALRRLPKFAKARSLVDIYSATLSSGSQTLSLDSLTDFVEEREIYYYKDDRRVKVNRLDFEEFNILYNSDTTGAPSAYRIYGNTVEFNCKADQDYSIKIEYFKLTDNVTASSTLLFNNDVNEILKDGALAYVYTYLEDDAKASKYMGQFVLGLEKIETEYHRQEDPDYIQDTD